MKPRSVLVGLMAMLLVIPAASAYGAEPANQEVNVRVLPTNALAIQVDGRLDFGGMLPGDAAQYKFWIKILNTTASGWEVTVTGDDLYAFNWESCDQNGCHNPIPAVPPLTIDKSNLVITGGDLDWWDAEHGDTIVPSSGSPGAIGSPTTILQATSFAFGEFGLDNPMATAVLNIPSDAEQGQQYRTDLVYTIMPWTP